MEEAEEERRGVEWRLETDVRKEGRREGKCGRPVPVPVPAALFFPLFPALIFLSLAHPFCSRLGR